MRPLDSNGHPESLPHPDVLEILQQHLPYRRALLLDAVARIPARTMADNQAFEAGVVAGRSLLSFLGIRYDRRTRRLADDHTYQRETGDLTDDIKAPDVGGRFVDISRLSRDSQNVLERFIHGAHKASAHLTWKSTHTLDVETYQTAATIISDLLERHIFNAGPGGASTAGSASIGDLNVTTPPSDKTGGR